MKKHLFPLFLLLLGVNAQAQQDIYAITGKETQSISFNDFRTIDAINGTSGDKIFTTDSSAKVFSQTRRGTVAEDRNSYSNSQAVTLAALAYDSSNNSLVYMPMFSSNIYILNPQTKEITLVENNVARVTSCDINSHITRMATGYNGNIYAVNNAGTQFLEISKKNGQYVVNDLGIIKDDTSNGRNSFTAMETGFGGDMIADEENNFYIFAASGNVFKVLTKDLKAKFVGKIAGIPDNYSVNGAAVNSQGKVVVASAKGAALYEVDLLTLQGKQIPGEQGLHIYDLASKYFVNDKASAVNTLSNLDIYPTKVDEHFINVHVNNNIKGNIKLNIFDMSGKNVMTENLSIKESSSDQKVYLKGLISGAYIVNIVDESGKVILNKKILVTK
ncbi:T9SS type A sorting domain-containing protein [Chryseobacterium sp. MEBOG07]|uniref:T9SS type A sorting domain-containing protein n=1 Tax=Chryseobacterium sp. MEBOG07 TaxID=2879939 RepID=UPI001F455FF1|nr:T9SS type A sorting domain-containing protein [Chryseobacterium sp. MEBOG07]UKB79135.1 T9SS type A sorting domain-containing protein [Chryseobacterium sp. MEBOG07]